MKIFRKIISSFVIANLLFVQGLVYPIATVYATGNPSVVSINRANTSPTKSTSVDFIVTFSQPVNGVDATDFAASTTGTVTANVANVAGSGGDTVYTVTVNTIAGDGNLGLNLVDNDSIQDVDDNSPLGGAGDQSFTTGQVYAVDNTVPTVSDISSTTTNGTYKIGDAINVTATFSESVNVTGSPKITLETGTTDRDAMYSTGSGSNTLTFTYTVQAGDVSADLDYVTTTSLDLNSGTIKDAAGNDATLTLVNPGDAHSLAANKAIVVDGVVPVVTDAKISISASSFKIGDTVTATWDNTAGGDNNTDIASVKVDFSQFGGGSAVTATNSSDTWTATYMFVAGSINNVANKNVSVTATDSAGNSTTTADTTNATVDNVAPTVTVNQKSGQVDPTNSSPINFTAVFSEAVTGFVDADVSLGGTNTGTTTATVTTADNITYNIAVTGMNGDGTVTASIAMNKAQDSAGNNNAASTSTDNTVTSDTVAPVLAEVTPVTNPTNDTTPNYTFHTTESGTITYGGDCSSATTAASTGNNTITFNALTEAMHSNCTIKVTDSAGNQSSMLNVSSFTVDATAPTAAVTYSINHAVKSGNTQTITATFSETITGTPKIALSGADTVSATDMTATGNPLVFTYDYVVGSGDGTENVTISNVTDTSLNPITGTPTSGATFTLDNTGATAFTVGSVITTGGTIVAGKWNATNTGVDVTVPVANDASLTGGTIQLRAQANGTFENIGSPYTIMVGDLNTAKTISLTDTQLEAVSGFAEGANITFKAIVTDLAGNSTTGSVSTTSLDIDQTTPVLDTVSIASNNTTSTLAKVGDSVTVSFTSHETIQTPTVMIAGHTATVGHTGNNWTATYVMASGDTNGSVSFNISFADIAGNAGVDANTVTDSSSVTFDKTAPGLTAVSIASDNTNQAYAKVGTTATVSFTSTETIQTPTITINGHTATVNTPTGNNWSAYYTFVSGDTAGVVTFTVDYQDLSGNTGTQVAATTDSSAVIFDKTAPVISTVALTNTTTGNNTYVKNADSVTLTAHITDANQGVMTTSDIFANLSNLGGGVAVNPSSYNTATGLATWSALAVSGTVDANETVTVDATDEAGNAATQGSTIIDADNSVPVVNTDVVTAVKNTNLVIAEADLLSNDTDAGNDTLSVTSVSSPLHGTVSRSGGNVTFVPDHNFMGAAQYTYTVSDGSLSSSGTVSITVNPLISAGQALIGPSVTVDSSHTQTVVGATTSDSTITIPASINNATLDLTNLVSTSGSNNNVTLTNAININSSTSMGNVSVVIPANITITGPAASWGGIINAPSIQTLSSVTLPNVSGADVHPDEIVEVGFGDVPLTFDKAVRILIANEAGRVAAYSRGGVLTEITNVCATDSQLAADAGIVAGGDCRIDVGNDMVIWTKHFSKFVSYSRNYYSTATAVTPANTTGAPVCNDARPTGSPTFIGAVAGTNSVTLTWLPAADPVSYYLITYGAYPGAQTYGNPNVGGNGTRSYTVGNLSGGTTYYFRIRAGNGCTPGSYSGEVSATPGGGFVSGTATGFIQGVLGAKATAVSTDENNGGETTVTSDQNPTTQEQTPSLQTLTSQQPVKSSGGFFSAIGHFFGGIFGFIGHIFRK